MVTGTGFTGTPFTNVPFYGNVPYNGFGYGYGYNGESNAYNNNSGNDLNDANQSIANANVNGGTSGQQPASPAAATSNPEANAARSDMMAVQSRVMKDFMATDEYRQALADVRKASDAFNSAVRQANGSVADTGEVKKAEQEKLQAEKQVEAQQAAHQVAPTTQGGAAPAAPYAPELTQAAQKKLDATTEIKHAKEDKVMQIPAVQEAKKNLDTSVAHFEELRAKYEAQVTGDKDWQASKKRLDTAMAGSAPSNHQ